jgi:malate permease and related proteins
MCAMNLLETIAPIFLIILIGYLIRRLRVLRDDFFSEANRFVYFFSLPVLIFTGIVKSGLQTFSFSLILVVVLPTVAVFFLACGMGRLMGLTRGQLGTFVQSTYHGNVSYIGLAVVFYMLGEEAFRQGSIMVGFLVLTTNLLSSIILSLATSRPDKQGPGPLASIAKNPVIISSLAGIAAAYVKLPIPVFVMKSMGILANIALPLALVTIGASLTPASMKQSWKLGLFSSGIKLLLLPALAVVLLRALKLPPREGLTGILLLATPVATLTYIMAEQLGGDGELASNAVTLSTILSLFSYMGWALFLGIA